MTHPDTTNTYNQLAAHYDQHVDDPALSPLHMYYEKPAIHAEMPDLNGRSVLSIACGSGNDMDWLAGSGASHIAGIDISSGLIELAKSKYPATDLRVMDMEQLDFEDESFDVAYSSLALHYLGSWVQALTEARRVLRPDGLYVFSCNHPLETALEYRTSAETREASIGRTILQATEERQIHGDYMAAEHDGAKPIITTVADQPVHSYHHTFSRMFADIQASGFRIEKLVEPLPQEEMQTANPDYYNQVIKMPKFLIWVLRK